MSLLVLLTLIVPMLCADVALYEIAKHTISPALADALTMDGCTVLFLGTLNNAGVLRGIPLALAFPFTVGAAAGQFVRRTCKNYTSTTSSVMCGALAGATKYGTRSLLAGQTDILVQMLRGGIDIANYELDFDGLMADVVSERYAHVISRIYRNELFNSFLSMTFCILLGKPSNLATVQGIATAFLFPTMISLSIFCVSLPFQATVQNTIDTYAPWG